MKALKYNILNIDRITRNYKTNVTFLILLSLLNIANGLHLVGQWKTSEFFLFLGRFGFQQTNSHEVETTQGYIYGNVTASQNVSKKIAFVVVDSEYFLDYFSSRSTKPRTKACSEMFSKIDGIAWDRTCNAKASQDFLRYVPCTQNKFCDEEDSPEWVIPGSQFTYHVRDTKQPRYKSYFVAMKLIS